ncbi:nucleotidyltransferase domain-containing protein [Nocardia flavorosea]|uniref:nucleotidyltransferase domain-containing protein n=1 Tax=Nocardia flavorosea TaxID=53429 RepID=UPI001894238E|nr:nucleotidyltransferase domain-containing protein [Nocardia flavorosea]MBF6347751.1 nucleotidyltransferase domain-containing protein [Nocardia flavorosea]
MDHTKDLLLEGVVGSTAYGLAGPASDIDYAGIYVEPTRNLLGLHPPSRQTRQGRDGADATYHEIGKAMRLMLSCNPTATEILWLDGYTAESAFGRELVGLRACFLSATRVRDAFFGYATSQFRRLAGPRPPASAARRAKHARHTMRLLWQGYELYTTGRLPIRVPDPDRYHALGAAAAADPGAGSVHRLLADYEYRFDTAATALPPTPDEAPLDDFLHRVRRAHLDSPEAAARDEAAL